MVKESPTWLGMVLTLVVGVAAVTVWAYSTFTTEREHDATKSAHEQRLTSLEQDRKEIANGQAEMKGMLLMIQDRLDHPRGH